jgi:hypothetical protein
LEGAYFNGANLQGASRWWRSFFLLEISLFSIPSTFSWDKFRGPYTVHAEKQGGLPTTSIMVISR